MKRDYNIVKAFQKEINLRTSVVKDRKKYQRKLKHKGKSHD